MKLSSIAEDWKASRCGCTQQRQQRWKDLCEQYEVQDPVRTRLGVVQELRANGENAAAERLEALPLLATA